MSEKDMGESDGWVDAYMCLVDWQHEAPFNDSGNRIYYSVESLKKHRPCVLKCGIVKVRVKYQKTMKVK